MTIEWLGELRQGDSEDAPVLYRIGREGTTRIAEWPRLATLRHGADGTSQFTGADGADPRRVAKVEAGLARALVRSLAGGITLHASGVARGDCGIACVGPSGAGKSTIARALVEHGGDGAELLADDMAPLDLAGTDDAVRLLPSERAVWLCADEGQMEKCPIDMPYAQRSTRLVALVTLGFDDGGPLRLEPLPPAAVFARLIPAIVRFALDDPEAHLRELAAVGDLCRRVPGFELHRPRDLTQLSATAAVLAPLLATGYISSP